MGNILISVVSLAEMELPDIIPKYIEIFGLKITETMISCAIVVLALLLFAAVIRIFFIPRWEKSKSTSALRMGVEGIVEMFDSTAKSTTGRNAGFVGAWYFAMALMICFGTLIELFGLRPPISDLNMALMLGLGTFVLIQFYGIKERRWRRVLRYFPNVINIVTDAVVPISMSLRLFGSIFSGYLIMHLIYTIPYPIIYPAIGNIIFTLFHALIQSYIFMVLSMNFIEEATE